MEWLKSQLASWKVRVALVGGALVIATSYGTCTLDPAVVSTNDAPVETSPPAETVEVSATTTGTTDEDGVDDTTVGNNPTTTE